MKILQILCLRRYCPANILQLNWTQSVWGPRYIAPARTLQKHNSCYGLLPCDSPDTLTCLPAAISNVCSFSRSLHINGAARHNIVMLWIHLQGLGMPAEERVCLQ
jgi:hypothetical protein